jgi:hypothetical protein
LHIGDLDASTPNDKFSTFLFSNMNVHACLVPHSLQNLEAGGNSAPHLKQVDGTFTNLLGVACLGLCVVLGFNMTYAVNRARVPITIAATAMNEPSVNPRTAEAGTRLVELSVVEVVKV